MPKYNLPKFTRHFLLPLILVGMLFTMLLPTYSLASLSEYVEIEVKEGDSFSDIMESAGISAADYYDAANAMSSIYDPLRLHVGNVIRVEYSKKKTDKRFRGIKVLEIFPSGFEKIEVRKNADNNFEVKKVKVPITKRVVSASGEIKTTLFSAAREAGIPLNIRNNFVKKYSYDVDFQRDLRQGDRFDILYEQLLNPQGKVVGGGDIIYASLQIKKGDIDMYRFQNLDGSYDYYSPEGRSVQKSFLRTPIDGASITSSFGAREHPIMGFTKMHKGVDFGAPKGTPVYASGSGVVLMASKWGAYGNYIKIRNSDEYSTVYAHLDRFNKGIKEGSIVKQGDIIGFVGTTGRSTGPHLHYEILSYGEQVNPLSIETVASNQLKGLQYGIFVQYIKSVNRQMAALDSKDKIIDISKN